MTGPQPEHESTEYIGTGDGGTVVLVSSEYHLILSLVDQASPDRCFEAPLDPQARVSVGRSPANRIVLDYERSVSASHCEIYLEDAMIRIRDLNSRNGTYVDGIRVADTAEIFNGSIIKLGRTELKVNVRSL